ncbi:MAG: LamB/YcsF family protein, partial [Armatimonadetes bacterium]|nr:LamB/YcsF family protein [Armatimonadota bacterium]
ITDPGEAAGRARRLVTEGLVTAVSGETIAVRADTLCMHSDTPGAAALAAAVRRVLLDAGVRIAPLREWLFMT